MRATLAALALAAVAACGTSPKTHFFVLSAVPGEDGQHAAVPFRIQLAAVHLPPSLDRRQLVRMTGDNTVSISDTDRWSGPLDEMVRNVLSQDLAERLPSGTVVLPDAPTAPGTRTVVVTLAEFGADASAHVTLRGSWALLDPASNAPVMDRDVRLEAGSAATPDATAAAMSRALGELADAIATGIATRELAGGKPAIGR
jgi:uncharacterized lipoprotein YmbA